MLGQIGTGTVMAPRDVCIVGAGPVGIALALACEEREMSVLLLESGGVDVDPFAASLSAGHRTDPSRHAPAGIATCRGLGGTSRWWGRRCVPFDDIDFVAREVVRDAAWLISHRAISQWYSAAAAFLGVGEAKFCIPDASWSELAGADLKDLERWTPVVNIGKAHRERLEKSLSITVLLGATVTRLVFSADGKSISNLVASDRTNSVGIKVSRIVLTCGGIETTRLLLAMQRSRPKAFGGPNGALGRYYMGHISGKIADIVLADPSLVAALDFFCDGNVFARRRFTLPAEVLSRVSLLNIAFWADNPPFFDAEHGNGALSLAWIMLALRPLGRIFASEGVRVSHVGPRP
jgi:hypothetical protein